VQDFYDNVAGTGNVNITGTVEGWVTVPHSEGYYGANDCTTDNDGAIVPVGQLVIDAMKVYSTSHATYYTDTSASAFWPKYDQNKDGLVDAFWLVHAGMDEAGGGGQQGPFAIWSHSWSLAAQNLSFKVYEGSPLTTTDDIYISPYTMQPENLDLGVTAEEFGHNFFGLPDLYTVDAQNSVGNWVGPMSSGSWMGWLGGTAPVGMPLWFRMIASYRGPGGTRVPLNWQEPMVTRAYTETAGTVTIGQLEKTPDGVNKGVRINLPGIPENIPNNAGTGKGAFAASANNADYRLTRSLAVGATATGTLTLNAYWDTELNYDYGQVMINGQAIRDTTGFMTEGGYGWGVTGQGGPETLSFNLSAYKGQTVNLTLRLACDEGTNLPGYWVDDVKLDGTTVDDFEGATVPGTFPNWTNDGNWQVVPVDRLYESYYLVEWRTKTHYDKMVKTAYVATDQNDSAILWRVERTPYNIPAALIYYRNQKYPGGYYQRPTYNDPPSFGPKNKLLIVDMNYQPMRIVPTSTTILSSRSASYDAGLTLQPTERITITKLNGVTSPPGPYIFPSKPAVTQFSDALGYYAGFYYNNGYYYSNRDGSTVIPARGPYSTRITHFDLTPFPEMYEDPILNPYYWWGGTGNPGDDNVQYGVNVKLLSMTGDTTPYSSTATLRVGNLSVDKIFGPTPADISRPGVYTFTYTVGLFNQGLASTNATVTMTLPAGLYLVSYNPTSGGSTVIPPATGLLERKITWGGFPVAAGSAITFTMVATTEAKLYDPFTTWTAKADVDVGDGVVTHHDWVTTRSLFAAGVEAVDGTTKVGVNGGSVVHTAQIINSGYTTDTFQVEAVTQPGVWFTA
ncbi:MAG: immune inhibitor A, partial [Methanothrix sp.]|nr:immune inhibitor A [Methanothrix sp.]